MEIINMMNNTMLCAALMMVGLCNTVVSQGVGSLTKTLNGTGFYDEQCSNVPECLCYLSGDDYIAECLDLEMDFIPDNLSYNITVLSQHQTQLNTVTKADLEPYLYLRVLDFAQNQITSLEAGLLDNFPDLEIFKIENNLLTTLPNNFFAMTVKLKEFHGQDNQLTVMPRLAGLTELTEVDVQDNMISQIPPDTFTVCGKVIRLNMANNRLTSLSANGFTGLSSLRYLDLSSNTINSIQSTSFNGLQMMQEVFLKNNDLTHLPSSAFQASTSTLTYIDLSDNQLVTLDNSAFVNLPYLISMDLGGNKLAVVPEALNALTAIKVLTLQGNDFVTIGPDAFSGLSTLQELFLSNMETLTSVNVHAFDGLLGLTRLSLDSNQMLTELKPEHFLELTSIQQIYLNDCGFAYLDELLFSNLGSLTYVDLYRNPLNCSCDLKWMPRVVNEGVVWAAHWATSTKPACHTPVHLKDWPIPGMTEEDMTCEPLVIEPVSQQQQITHLKGEANITVRLHKGLPRSVWLSPDGQVTVPLPIGDHPLNIRRYATWQLLEENVMESVLHLKNASTLDEGQYVIRAENIVGHKTSDFRLIVLPYELTTPPYIPPSTEPVSSAHIVSTSCLWVTVLSIVGTICLP